MAPLRVRLSDGSFREPDIVFVLESKASSQGNRYWDGADLVMEVVSPDDPHRDWVDKRQAYAASGIGEYWIVDPASRTILVLKLENGQYVAHDQATSTGWVHSSLLDGFAADVTEVFRAGRKS
jgi:Uma2 family endonuclease